MNAKEHLTRAEALLLNAVLRGNKKKLDDWPSNLDVEHLRVTSRTATGAGLYIDFDTGAAPQINNLADAVT